MAVLAWAIAIAVPLAAWSAWPFLRRRMNEARFLRLPPDAREQLIEQKRVALRALRELEFEHEAGHLSDEDFADLRRRYESEAATLLSELDRLGPAPAAPAARPAASESRRSAWRHPVAVVIGGIALVVFGAALGVGLIRYTAPEASTADSSAASRPLGSLTPPGPPGGAPGAMPQGEITPQVLAGMLQAARESLFAGRYTDAISAYRAILNRDPKNLDAMTHLALIVAIGGHEDSALETFDRVLKMDPNYPPALLYKGQVLMEAKRDAPGAIAAWEKFVKVVPSGEDHDRVVQLLADAKAGRLPAPGR